MCCDAGVDDLGDYGQCGDLLTSLSQSEKARVCVSG